MFRPPGPPTETAPRVAYGGSTVNRGAAPLTSPQREIEAKTKKTKAKVKAKAPSRADRSVDFSRKYIEKPWTTPGA